MKLRIKAANIQIYPDRNGDGYYAEVDVEDGTLILVQWTESRDQVIEEHYLKVDVHLELALIPACTTRPLKAPNFPDFPKEEP